MPERKPFMLTREQTKQLRDVEPDITHLTSEIQRAERAGMDVTELKTKIEKLKVLRLGLIREFGQA